MEKTDFLNIDPIEYLLDKFGFDRKFIRNIASGRRYYAIELVNGNIGVCATLGDKLPNELPDWINPELIRHRIILCAYFNAMLNYRSENVFDQKADITEAIDFSKYKNIHFIGRFQPVFEKLDKKGINYTYSDLRYQFDPNNLISQQTEIIQRADCLIISATAIYNQTFLHLLKNSPYSDKYILGPSSTMSPEFCNWNIKKIFGVRFKPYDSRVLGLIAQDYGTQYFLKRGQKVYMQCDFTDEN